MHCNLSFLRVRDCNRDVDPHSLRFSELMDLGLICWDAIYTFPDIPGYQSLIEILAGIKAYGGQC